ncbi:MAG: hypothetical protein KME13_02835 [Myxacorys californica WJT36-NPBG1]|jgi:hypothetical protein|nr:hypothetical protein [Myxacorys californica WJT36-NPBG1]
MKRINSTVALTFVLLALMFGAGIVSSAWGFAIGREALKGITQPDSRPTNKVNRKNPNGREQLTFLKEDDILATVKSRIGGTSKPPASPSPSSSPQSKTETSKNNQVAATLPLLARDKDVALEITGIQQQKDSVTLDVAMKNDSNQAIRFLYSALNVTDDRGRAITVDTTGLPSEMPAKSDRYTGTVNISAALLANAQKLSLQLTDYPDQKLQLKLSEIPVR